MEKSWILLEKIISYGIWTTFEERKINAIQEVKEMIFQKIKKSFHLHSSELWIAGTSERRLWDSCPMLCLERTNLKPSSRFEVWGFCNLATYIWGTLRKQRVSGRQAHSASVENLCHSCHQRSNNQQRQNVSALILDVQAKMTQNVHILANYFVFWAKEFVIERKRNKELSKHLMTEDSSRSSSVFRRQQ